MIISSKNLALTAILESEQNFKFPIQLLFITKIQLYLSGNILKGIEVFGIGPQEIRGFGFLVEFHELINNAINNNYRVFVVKDGTYFSSGNWHLEFTIKGQNQN